MSHDRYPETVRKNEVSWFELGTDPSFGKGGRARQVSSHRQSETLSINDVMSVEIEIDHSLGKGEA